MPDANQTAVNDSTASQSVGDHRAVRYRRCSVETPIGRLEVVVGDRALVTILFDLDGPMSDSNARNPAVPRLDIDEIPVVDPASNRLLDGARRQLAEYFDGTRTRFDLPLEPTGTAFQRNAWAALQRIPFGTTVSYGEQAESMGDRRKARAVGAANGKNPLPIVIPCHRVVGADGSLTGFAGGVQVKGWLLTHERARLQLQG